MARLEQPSASANASTPMDSATQSETGRPTRTGVLPLVGILAALAIAAGAFFYYQSERDDGTASAVRTTTIGNTAPTAVETTPLGTESTSSTASSAGANSANATTAKPHRIARASKPTQALEPRDRQVFLAVRPQPAYPLPALRAGEQGTVLVLAQVNVDGRVTDARVVRHSGSRILDRAAPNEVRQWKFEPALHDGRPVVASIQVPVNYRLNQ
jgi:periplasmic protein TonB